MEPSRTEIPDLPQGQRTATSSGPRPRLKQNVWYRTRLGSHSRSSKLDGGGEELHAGLESH